MWNYLKFPNLGHIYLWHGMRDMYKILFIKRSPLGSFPSHLQSIKQINEINNTLPHLEHQNFFSVLSQPQKGGKKKSFNTSYQSTRAQFWFYFIKKKYHYCTREEFCNTNSSTLNGDDYYIHIRSTLLKIYADVLFRYKYLFFCRSTHLSF